MVHFNGGAAQARAVGTNGRQTTLMLLKGRLPADVVKVRVMGREASTNAERARDAFVLRVLQGQETLDESQFVRMLWFPTARTSKGKKSKKTQQATGAVEDARIATPAFLKLNASQQAVVRAMIGAHEPLIPIRGMKIHK